MIYSDEENKRWWDGKTNQDKKELFETVIEKSSDPTFSSWIEDAYEDWREGEKPRERVLQELRKWDSHGSQ